jgi:hypothetical protein
MSGGSRPQRVRQAHVEWLLERLSSRDQAVIFGVGRVRLLTSSQIERLYFPDLSGRSRSVVRSRVLKRLIDWRVLTSLPRRIGGISGGGSAQTVYALDSAGQSLYAILSQQTNRTGRIRRPSVPGERFVRHTLTISELYVLAIEAGRSDKMRLVAFTAEPEAWFPDGLGGLMKPDAYLVVSSGETEDTWAVEVDKATEHVPALRRKLTAYLDYVKRGELGPDGVLPRVLITVPDERRLLAVSGVIAALPEPASKLFMVSIEDHAISLVVEVLRE